MGSRTEPLQSPLKVGFEFSSQTDEYHHEFFWSFEFGVIKLFDVLGIKAPCLFTNIFAMNARRSLNELYSVRRKKSPAQNVRERKIQFSSRYSARQTETGMGLQQSRPGRRLPAAGLVAAADVVAIEISASARS